MIVRFLIDNLAAEAKNPRFDVTLGDKKRDRFIWGTVGG